MSERNVQIMLQKYASKAREGRRILPYQDMFTPML